MDFFYQRNTHRYQVEDCDEIEITHAVQESETITLPRKNWRVPTSEYFTHFMRSQGMMLRVLMQTTYLNIEGIKRQRPSIQ